MVDTHTIDPKQLQLVSELERDRWLAHQVLFKERHPIEPPDFHPEMVRIFNSDERFVVFQAFRDAAKSTNAEEDIALMALYHEFDNCLIIGASEDRAIDRLRSIKNELVNNDMILEVYGNQVGGTWAETKIVLKNGVVIQAFGREQSLRGCKHLDKRPDFCLIDDLEDETTAKDDASIKQCMKWVMKTLVPALQPTARLRMLGTPLHPKAIVNQFAADPEWISRIWPIKYLDDEGNWKSSWPAKFPLADIFRMEARYARQGMTDIFNQEYMMKAEDEASKPFKSENFKTEATPRSWHGVWACYDPARTVKEKSAQTGKAVWSWIGNRLIIWDAIGRFWRPDQIIDDIMETNREYNPVGVGVEKEGLEEFIMQPLRQAMVKHQEIVPLVTIKAPVGKNDFIKSLQPFFRAGEIIFAKPLPELEQQLKDFPSGLKDIVNALAYALKMRPGLPVYEDFGSHHVSEKLVRLPQKPYWLLLNARDGIAAGILCQHENGLLRVFADWMMEGDMLENLKTIMESAAAEADGRLKVMSTPKAMDQFSNSGMRGAARQKNIDLRKGLEPDKGREHIATGLRTQRRGLPEIMVSMNAIWTLRAFAGGYALHEGIAQEGHYKILMEGLESFTALMKVGFMAQENSDRNYAYTNTGQKYLTSRPAGRA